MKIVCNFEIHESVCYDEGDYPCAVAARALPPYRYIESINGAFRVEREAGDSWPPNDDALDTLYAEAAAHAQTEVEEWGTVLTDKTLELRPRVFDQQVSVFGYFLGHDCYSD